MWWLIFPGAALLLLAAVLIRSAFEREMLSETVYEIPVEGLPEVFSGTSLLFLSDLHDQRFGKDGKALPALVSRTTAEAVLIGGDMFTVKKGHSGDMAALEEILEAVPEELPVYYALGNHETRMRQRAKEYPGWQERFTALLEKYGVTVLDNASAYLEKEGGRIRILGMTLDRKYYQKGHTEKMNADEVRNALGPSSPETEIVLLHSPMYGDVLSEWGADIVLSGHFHGGTVRLPGLGGVMTPQLQFFSPLSKGEKHYGKTTEIISGGLGTHSIRIRFLNKPEVIYVRLIRKETQ